MHAPRPGLADRLLEAEDELVLVDLLEVSGDRGAHVVGRGDVAIGVDRTELLADDREQVGGAGDRVGALFHAVEHVVGVFVRRSEEQTSELQSLMRITYALFCLKKQKNISR